MKAFLMIGQSNMAGRGDFEEVTPIVHPRLHMVRNGRWQPLSEPVNPDRSIVPFGGDNRFHSGISLGPSFALAYAEHYDEDVGLIPCADGGTRIDQWAEGEILFDHAVMMTKLALRNAELAGILWHQGESDSATPEQVNAYYDRLCAFFAALRKALRAETVPVIMGELCHQYGSAWQEKLPYTEQINGLIHRAADTIGNAGVASSDGLTTRVDGIHFNSTSYRTFGRRYFEVYQTIVNQNK